MAPVRTLLSLTASLGMVLLTACGSATLPTGADRFDIPSYSWDKQGGMAALVSGRLSFTPDGCTLMVSEEGDGLAQPVIFPNAAGIRFDNGVRAVIEADSGTVYAIEGQEFSYGGGWVPPSESWTQMCGDYAPDDIAHINDAPTLAMPAVAPEPYTGTLPTEIPSLAERGWYAVPTFEWDPAQAGEQALLEGTVTMTDDGCATVESPDRVTGLVFPNAWGKKDDGYAGGHAIFSWFQEGSGIMAEDEMAVSYAGGSGDVSGELGAQWEELCPSSPIDTLFAVQEHKPWQ